MSEPTRESASEALSLPDAPSLEWLRKQAKRQLEELQRTDPATRLAAAQFDVANATVSIRRMSLVTNEPHLAAGLRR